MSSTPGTIRSEDSELAAVLEESAQLAQREQPLLVALPVVAAEDSVQEEEQLAAAFAASLQQEPAAGLEDLTPSLGDSPITAQVGLAPLGAQASSEAVEEAERAAQVEPDGTLRATARELELAPISFSGLRTQTSVFGSMADEEQVGQAADGGGGGVGGGGLEGFPSEDLHMCLGEKWATYVGCGTCIAVIVMIAVLIPSSIETIDSAEVGLAYDHITSTLSDSIMSEGLNSKPMFGSIIKWPITNQRIDLNLTCNSLDAIQIELTVDFLYIPVQTSIYDLTLKYINFEGYTAVVQSASRSSVRNACGNYDARQFQTARAAVASAMEQAVRKDLAESLSTTVLTLNLRNIDRPKGYQDAVSASEAALADIELAKKEEEQKLIKAKTVLATAQVEADKIINRANTTSDILVQTAVQQVTEAAKADVVLATTERLQALTKANTTLKTASITADVIQNAADTEAQITTQQANQQYASILDKYNSFAKLLAKAQSENGFDATGALAYCANSVVGGKNNQKIALPAPAKFSYQADLTPGATPTP